MLKRAQKHSGHTVVDAFSPYQKQLKLFKIYSSFLISSSYYYYFCLHVVWMYSFSTFFETRTRAAFMPHGVNVA